MTQTTARLACGAHKPKSTAKCRKSPGHDGPHNCCPEFPERDCEWGAHKGLTAEQITRLGKAEAIVESMNGQLTAIKNLTYGAPWPLSDAVADLERAHAAFLMASVEARHQSKAATP